MIRISAGTCRPASRQTISPGIRSAAGISRIPSSSWIRACGLVIFSNASNARFAFPSWITPTTAFNSTTASIMHISPYSRSSRDIAAAANKIKISGSQSCSTKHDSIDFCSSLSNRLYPRFCPFPCSFDFSCIIASLPHTFTQISRRRAFEFIGHNFL